MVKKAKKWGNHTYNSRLKQLTLPGEGDQNELGHKFMSQTVKKAFYPPK